MKWIAVPRSEQALMGIVFASRLIPFISFDAVSYAAGVTNLTFGRFAISTAFGIVPIFWALAAMGAGMATEGMHWMIVVLVAGGVTLIPVLAAGMRKWR